MSASELPAPDASACEHSERLIAMLLERIGDSAMSFADYMQYVLYTPGLGYYMAGNQKFGAAGDFVTAPEVSPLFGRCLARQCREILDALAAMPGGAGTGRDAYAAHPFPVEADTADPGPGILELGAGSGRLAVSLLRELATAGCHVPYYILEPSAELQARQAGLLNSSLPESVGRSVRWLDTLPPNFQGVVIANEVMDALPCERFRQAGSVTPAVEQAAVTVQGDQLSMAYRQAPVTLAEAVAHIENDLGQCLPPGYESEVNLLLPPWLQSLADMMSSGVLLLIDYGYPRREFYLPERQMGTLSCYYRHHMHDNPLLWPGLTDITAHVDFTQVAEAGTRAGLELLGYTSQAAFLQASGLLDIAEADMRVAATERDRLEIAQQVRKLTLPGEMGERFQVIGFGKGYDRAPGGFIPHDLSHRL